MQAPRTSHMLALEHTLHYLKGTSGQGILLKANSPLLLKAFSDSDWASCSFSRRSVTGYRVLAGTSPISWKSKKQPTVSKSSAEAEYRPMSQAAAEVTWLVCLLSELGIPHKQPVTLRCDNQSTLQIAKNPVFHKRPKHMEINCHLPETRFLKDCFSLLMSLHLSSWLIF